MRVLRASGENISPSDDASLFREMLSDGLFEDVSITSLGSNQVSIPALYGIIQGREFTNSAETITVELPASGTATGYIYVQYDLNATPIGTIESALAPFTPVYDDINSGGSVAQMVLATYQASAIAVTSITSAYENAAPGGKYETSITLLASSWNSSNQITISDAKISPQKEIILTYPSNMTDAQFTAYRAAGIRPYGNIGNGSMTLKAVDGKPTVNLPMILIIKG